LPDASQAVVWAGRWNADTPHHPVPSRRGVHRRGGPQLKPIPDEAFDIPTWSRPKAAPDRHVPVANALYSVRGELVGRRLDACADAHTVKLYWRGELAKVHRAVAPGRRRTDPADLPTEVSIYAMRDINTLQRKASAHGTHVGDYAAAVLEHPLPWTKMRQVYRLLGLMRRHGANEVDNACRRALDAEFIDIGLIERMLSRGTGEQLPLIENRRRRRPDSSAPQLTSPCRGRHKPSPPRRHTCGQADRGVCRAHNVDAPPQTRPAARHPPGTVSVGAI
jgi:hypothetical protein